MLKSILPRPTLNHYLSVGDAGDGGDGGGGDGGAGDGGGGSGGGNADDKRFTQADLDKAASARANEAKRKAATDLAETLGVSVEEAKGIIAAHKEAQDKDRSDTDKANKAAAEAKAAADAATASANRAEAKANVTLALVKNGVKVDAIEDSLTILGDIEHDATPDEVEAKVKAFMERRPEFFGSPEDAGGDETDPTKANGGPPAPNGDPKGKPKGKGAEDKFAKGVERAKAAANGTRTYAFLESGS